MMRHWPTVPARERDSGPKGCVVRILSANPGASRSNTCIVASGVRSRCENPVPPVVMINPLKPSAISRSAVETGVRPSGTRRCSVTTKPARSSSFTSAGPDVSTRSPALTRSETVRTLAENFIVQIVRGEWSRQLRVEAFTTVPRALRNSSLG